MPLNDSYPEAICWVLAERKQRDGSVVPTPIGTGFVVSVPGRRTYYRYIVTASHVAYGEARTWVRLRLIGGGTTEVEVPEWVHHSGLDDVCVAPLGDGRSSGLSVTSIPASSLLHEMHPPELGERVYFLGLLSLYPSMADRSVPMVRSGTVGALYQEDVPLDFHGALRRVEAHLIDCRSFSGFSGSPCFFQQDNVAIPVELVASGMGFRVPQGWGERGTATLMLGLLSGHFPSWEKVRGVENAESKVNTGIGIVTPGEKILEVLMMDELADERRREGEVPDEVPAEADSIEPSEFERFEDLAQTLVQTPKPSRDENEG